MFSIQVVLVSTKLLAENPLLSHVRKMCLPLFPLPSTPQLSNHPPSPSGCLWGLSHSRLLLLRSQILAANPPSCCILTELIHFVKPSEKHCFFCLSIKLSVILASSFHKAWELAQQEKKLINAVRSREEKW